MSHATEYWVVLEFGSHKQFPTLEEANAEISYLRFRGIESFLVNSEPGA